MSCVSVHVCVHEHVCVNVILNQNAYVLSFSYFLTEMHSGSACHRAADILCWNGNYKVSHISYPVSRQC